MKTSCGLIEEGVVVGNVYDKYASKNPIVRRLMSGFEQALSGLVEQAAPRTIHELGCGEGYWVLEWNRRGFVARGSDFSTQAIQVAQANAKERRLENTVFERRSLYEVEAPRDSADLVVCCEVLEHLEHPDEGLQALRRIVTGHLILSVPREPIWRALNMARGRYLRHWGNTPGHLQHWSRRGFVSWVQGTFNVVAVRSPLPWTLLLCRARS